MGRPGLQRDECEMVSLEAELTGQKGTCDLCIFVAKG
jgi:hypothetical protein